MRIFTEQRGICLFWLMIFIVIALVALFGVRAVVNAIKGVIDFGKQLKAGTIEQVSDGDVVSNLALDKIADWS